jgi:predicted dehydrogenase
VPIAVAAVKAGKDVCCEKPLTRSIAEGRLLSDLVTQHKRVFRTDSEFRSIESFHRACELVRNERVGKLHTIRTGVPVDQFEQPVRKAEPVPPGLEWWKSSCG